MKRKLVLMTSALMTIGLLAACRGNSHDHEWGEATYTWAKDYSTCTALRVCKGDESHKEEETVNSVYQVTTSATCEAAGEGKYTATFENKAFEAQIKTKTIEAKGHKWGTPTYAWSNDYSSCTATRVCENDSNHKESETADSAYTVITPATCNVNGSAVYDVAFESDVFEAQSHEITLPATGHNWDTPTYNWSNDYSSCTATRVCKTDPNHIESETAYSAYTETVPATCNANGSAVYDVAFENKAFEVQSHEITLPAAGHSWGTPTYNWNNDYTKCTATRVCANDSNHIESETVDSTSVETPASYVVEGSITYTATFTNAAFSTQTYKQKTSDKIPYYGQVPLLSDDGKTLTYGLYPQTNVNDSTLVSALDELTTYDPSNGWYLYENAYYAKVMATPEPYIGCTFDNGTEIEHGTTYWFKCEPITWNVLSNNNGEYYLLSSVILDISSYYHSTDYRGSEYEIMPNNYEHSDIRSWLNHDFYNSAFALDYSYIQTTTVDNSASTTSPSDNPYVCGNTQDKVFLPSYKDYINSSYGFSTSTDSTNTRCCKTTDWARARGAYCDCDTSSSYLYNDFYWTRSPYSTGSSPTNADDVRVWYVNTDGSLEFSDCYYKNYGVRPAISIVIA